MLDHLYHAHHASSLHQRRPDRRWLPHRLLLGENKAAATLYLPSELATVSVPEASLTKAKVIAYRPKVVRGYMLQRAKLYRRHGHRFPRKGTVEALRRLGVGTAAIEATVHAEPLPKVIAARERRAKQVEQALETAYDTRRRYLGHL